MSKFRFKPEDGFTINPQNPHSDRYISIDRANALLEAHEKTLPSVFSCPQSNDLEFWGKKQEKADTHTALLWNIEPIERERE